MYKRLLAGLLIITPGLYAMDERAQQEAKERSAAMNALLTPEEAERVAVLKQAFDGCKEGFDKEGKPKRKLTQQQLIYFPRVLGKYIVSFLDDRPKHRHIAAHTKQFIPAVMTGFDSSIFDDMGKVLCQIDADPEIYTITRERTPDGALTVAYRKDRYTAVTRKNTLFITRSENGRFVCKLHPAYVQQLFKLSDMQLNYIVWLYDTLKKQALRGVEPLGIIKSSENEEATLRSVTQRLEPLSLEQCQELLRRLMIQARKLTRTPEQMAIHNSLPEAIRSCIERNYIFGPTAPAAAVVVLQ